jgi:type VI secretion system secreted protein VgrG
MRSFVRSFIPLALLCLVLVPALAQAQPAACTANCCQTGRESLTSPSAQSSFPQLGNQFIVIGCATRRYNCIAHTIGTRQRWVWPGDTVSAFNNEYGRIGYRRIATDYTGQSLPSHYSQAYGVDKIVLYATTTGGTVSVTHGAFQYRGAGGGWTSKLGSWPLIWHPRPESLSGPSYGHPIAVYARRRN